MRRLGWWILILVILSDLAVARWWWIQRRERRYNPQIVEAARRYGIDPALVKAVVWKESAFNPLARGLAGEIGLMQVRTLAAQEWAQAEKIPAPSPLALENPQTNTFIGAWYLAKLLKRYRQTDNPVAYALADYNAGRSNVLRWKTGGGSTNHSEFVQNITFPSTANYVRMVQERQTRYQGRF